MKQIVPWNSSEIRLYNQNSELIKNWPVCSFPRLNMETALIQFIEHSCSLKQQKCPHPPPITGFDETGIFRKDTKCFTGMVGFPLASLLCPSPVQN